VKHNAFGARIEASSGIPSGSVLCMNDSKPSASEWGPVAGPELLVICTYVYSGFSIC